MLVNIINKAIVVLIDVAFVVILLVNNMLTIDITYILCNVCFAFRLF